MDENTIRYFIALSLVKNLGSINAKKLLNTVGDIELIFKESQKLFSSIKLRADIRDQIKNKETLKLADDELLFAQKQKITILTLDHNTYPYRLKQCADSPLVIYVKGDTDLNYQKIISVVGTRNSTQYGESICAKFIKELAYINPIIVSGLAYGIDTHAHNEALKNGLDTVGVLAHGLNRLYPYKNKKMAEEIIEQGALVSDFASSSSLVPGNFPARNRLIAGLSDATIVVESDTKGGSLITADIANSYDRDVFTFPGKIGDKYSSGCHLIIKQNKAALIENAADLISNMRWDNEKQQSAQIKMFENFTDDEQLIIDLLLKKSEFQIDEIAEKLNFSINKLSSILLQLELKNAIHSMPGKIYQLKTI